jgi:hypothetical protein
MGYVEEEAGWCVCVLFLFFTCDFLSFVFFSSIYGLFFAVFNILSFAWEMLPFFLSKIDRVSFLIAYFVCKVKAKTSNNKQTRLDFIWEAIPSRAFVTSTHLPPPLDPLPFYLLFLCLDSFLFMLRKNCAAWKKYLGVLFCIGVIDER